MFKKIWTDPVWSKVISAGIIAAFVFLYALIRSLIDGLSFNLLFQETLNIKIPLVYVVGSFIIYLMALGVIAKVKGSLRKTKVTPEDILKKNNKWHDINHGILFKWRVFITFKGEPAVADLTPFCTKHEPPIRYTGNSCPVPSCENHSQYIDIRLVQNFLESKLINQFDKLNHPE